MQHFVAHSVPPHWLIHDWREAAELWRRLERLGPLRAAVIMPDHIHLILRRAHPPALCGLLSGYARWRNHHRAEEGRRVWLPAPAAEPLRSRAHYERSVRYVHLNPCRDGLVDDPLAWPFSTHRDAVGLSLVGIREVERDPAKFHGYVSADPSVAVEGTDLPYGLRGMREHSPEQVEAAASALARCTLDELRRRPRRTALIQALLALTPLSGREVAQRLGISPSAVHQTPPIGAAALARLERVLGDHRFEPLYDDHLPNQAAWRRYRDGRIRRGAYAKLLDEAHPRICRRSMEKRPPI
jgi:hypothetical protein